MSGSNHSRATTFCASALAISVFAWSASAREQNFGPPDQIGGYATTHILVRFAPSVVPVVAQGEPLAAIDSGPIDALRAAWGVTAVTPMLSQPPQNQALAEQHGLTRYYRLHVPAGTDTPTMAADFALLPGVEVAEVDGIGGIAQLIPNDPSFASQWNMHNTGQTGGTPDADIDAPEAWDIYTGCTDVIVAVLDTGVDADHPDLNGKVISGWNTYDNNGDTDDPHGHGSHVAGIVGAWTNNGIGVAGVNWNVTILAMRVTSATGTGTESQLADGLNWATNYGINIASMSLQYYSGTTALQDAINYAYDSGVLPIAAAGNGGAHSIAYPAKFPKCMAVGATDDDDAWWTSSNWGPELDVAAPGVNIYSLSKNGGYSLRSGTSMATPHVSGLASLIMCYNTSLSIMQIEQVLKDCAEDKGDPGFDEKFGWGRINAYNALLLADPRGDMNCDGTLNAADIPAFVLAFTNPAGYYTTYPDCDRDRADCNGDDLVNAADIPAFVDLLTE